MLQKKFKLSPSSLGVFEDCERCFWLTQHKIWERPSGPFPSLPSGMDLILKKHFDNFAKKAALPPELNSDETKNLKLFSDEKKLNIWRDNRKGIVFEEENGNILFGAVDNILVDGDELIVLDYKTRGFPLKDNTHEYYKTQMSVYTFLLEKNGYKTKDFAYLLFYFPKEVGEKGEIIFETELRKIKVNSEEPRKLFLRAISILNGECPKKKCIWCQHFRF